MCCVEETKATVRAAGRCSWEHSFYTDGRKGKILKHGYMESNAGKSGSDQCRMKGWTVAQVLKTLIDFALNKSFNAERLVGSGGMPEFHIPLRFCGLTTAAGLKYGAGSFEFAISFILAIWWIYM